MRRTPASSGAGSPKICSSLTERRLHPSRPKTLIRPAAGDPDQSALLAGIQSGQPPKARLAGSVPANELQPQAEWVGPRGLGTGALGTLGVGVVAAVAADQTGTDVLVAAGSARVWMF